MVLDNELLEKPADHKEAFQMLSRLSGRSHNVITGVCISASDGLDAFSVSTRVTFKELTNEGSYFNVVGLPIQEVYQRLVKYRL